MITFCLVCGGLALYDRLCDQIEAEFIPFPVWLFLAKTAAFGLGVVGCIWAGVRINQ